MTAVTIADLVIRYGAVNVIDHVNLRVESGELLSLLGSSASGKTTLLRGIAGFARPSSGAILFGAEDVTALDPHKRSAGMVFQSFALWPHLSVAQNVAFGLRERGVERHERDRRVAHALESVRMGHHGSRRVDELSGGEQQRVALARALVIRPRCLLLDEPLSNLDAVLRHSMREEIRRICKEFGLTTLYVTHDQKEALAIADRIALMATGRILQVGTPAEIYRRPACRAVATFVGETNLLPAIVTRTSAAEVAVDTEIGPLVAAALDSYDLRDGQRVWASIRPECWTLGQSPPARNVASGRIERSIYLGELAEHHFRTASNASLKVYQLNPRATRIDPGESWFVSAAPEDVVLIGRDADDV
jgi:iron(III) transport system ATP-binding protein